MTSHLCHSCIMATRMFAFLPCARRITFTSTVTRYDFSGAAAFARLDGLVRSTLSSRYGKRLYVESEADYSHEIVTY